MLNGALWEQKGADSKLGVGGGTRILKYAILMHLQEDVAALFP